MGRRKWALIKTDSSLLMKKGITDDCLFEQILIPSTMITMSSVAFSKLPLQVAKRFTFSRRDNASLVGITKEKMFSFASYSWTKKLGFSVPHNATRQIRESEHLN